MEQNILTIFLEKLNVKYTNEFAHKLYTEHPYKYNLYGISKMLYEYNIANAGFNVENKSLEHLACPFIAHFGSDFVVVTDKSLTNNKISYLWRGKILVTDIDNFKQFWSGVVLIAEPDKTSIEPDYKKHKKLSLFYKGELLAISIMILIGIFIAINYNTTYASIGLISLLLLNLSGIGTGYLLLSKQLHVDSRYADKICSLVKHADCNNVLESNAAKLGSYFSWSEIGIGYFISNFILVLFSPQLLSYLAVINVLALPYSIWSVWYQYKIAKQWCTLCLIVQALLWGIFLVNACNGNFILKNILLSDVLIVSIIYSLPILSISLLVRFLTDMQKYNGILHEINSLKATDEVFLTLLKKQQYCEVSHLDSQIIFGNPNAPIGITVLTNPHCEPCAKMHKRICSLLEKTEDKLYVQYIFSAFKDNLLPSNRFLISVFLHEEKDNAMKIYKEWFESGKYQPETFFHRFDFDSNSPEVQGEMRKHENWKTKNMLMSTPKILVNGYLLPENYKIEDLVYCIDMDFNNI